MWKNVGNVGKCGEMWHEGGVFKKIENMVMKIAVYELCDE